MSETRCDLASHFFDVLLEVEHLIQAHAKALRYYEMGMQLVCQMLVFSTSSALTQWRNVGLLIERAGVRIS